MSTRFSGIVDRNGLKSVCVDGITIQPSTWNGLSILLSGYLADTQETGRSLGLVPPYRCDETALIAYAYRRWGRALQARLSGEFALLVFDLSERSCLITHDGLGIAPLFYAECGDELIFATHLIEVDRLLSLATLDLDQEYFADYLATGYISNARTPYRVVKRLLPGMSLYLSHAGMRLERSWDLADVAPLTYADPKDYEIHFRALLDQGISGALGRRGATWVALSGGLDSSTIASVATRSLATQIGAYSLVIPSYPEANEELWMREVVEHCAMDWHPINVESVLPFSELPDGHLGEPSAAVINAALRRQTNALFAAHGVSTVLTGDGGDSILGTLAGPIPVHLSDPLFHGNLIEAFSNLSNWVKQTRERRSWAYWMSRALLRPALAHLSGQQIRSDAPLPLPPWLDRDFATRTDLVARDGRRIATRCKTPGLQQVWDTVWIGSLSMAASGSVLEGHTTRSPLLYRPLVEFMQAIPWEQKLKPQCDRFLQRRALKHILPERIRRRHGKAIGTWPIVEGLSRSREWQDYLCDEPQVAKFGITSVQAWRSAVSQAASGQTFGDRYFLTMVAIEVWLNGHANRKRREGDAQPVST